MTDRQEFIRPSSAAAIERCPGRPQMEARACEVAPFLRDLTSEPARQGTAAHEVIAKTITECAADWSAAPAVMSWLDMRTTGLAPWAKDATRECLRYALQLIKELGERYHIEIITERHLSGNGIGIARGGSADLIIICRNAEGAVALVVVCDWKTGFVSQGEAADHLQLACYAVMAYDQWRPSKGVEVHLCMGRRKEFSAAFYRAPEIAAVRRRVLAATAAAASDSPSLHVSLDACRYCKALPLCRAAREHIMHAVDSLALFGAEPLDRLRLADDAKLAERFAVTAKELLKEWQRQQAERDAMPQAVAP